MGEVSKKHTALRVEESGPVNIMHKCVDTKKKERYWLETREVTKRVAGTEKNQRYVGLIYILEKTKNFHSFNKYVLSTNQVLAKATKMKRQCLPTRGIMKKEICLMGLPRRR